MCCPCRAALRTYLQLLRTEVAAAEAALDTLNANEGALFPTAQQGGGGHQHNQTGLMRNPKSTSPESTVSKCDPWLLRLSSLVLT